MPTENERKYALDKDCEKKIALLNGKVERLNQGYLMLSKGQCVRVRSKEPLIAAEVHPIERLYRGTFLYVSDPDGKVKREFYYKQKTNSRLIEIEQEIDERDFDDLWQGCLTKCVKERHTIDFGGIVWEIDFFKDSKGETYFALAEIEMPEGQSEPEFVPKPISDNLLHFVSESDDRFSSKKLTCEIHARSLYESIES